MDLHLPNPDVRALVAGETIIAFVPPGTVAEGITVDLQARGPRPVDELKPAYRRWSAAGVPSGSFTPRETRPSARSRRNRMPSL